MLPANNATERRLIHISVKRQAKEIYKHTYKNYHVNKYMDQILYKVGSFSSSQEILLILWSPKVNYRAHKNPSPVPVLHPLMKLNATLSSRIQVGTA